MKDTFRDADFHKLAERCYDDSELYNPFKEFETTFFDMHVHTHILLTEWHWYKHGKRPIVSVVPLGVYDDLNKLAVRALRLINRELEDKTFEIHSDASSEGLDITVSERLSIQFNFMPLNRTDDCRHVDSWAFDIPKEDC